MKKSNLINKLFQKLFLSSSSSLYYVLALALVSLLTVQFFFLGYPLKLLLNEQAKDYLESWLQSNPTAAVTTSTNDNWLWSTITIKAEKYVYLAKAKLYINGKFSTDFRENPITIRVIDGDEILIETPDYNREISFKIIAVTGNLKTPQVGTVYKTTKSKVKFTVESNSNLEVQQNDELWKQKNR